MIFRKVTYNKKRIALEEVKKGMTIEIPLSWFKHPFWRSRFVIKNEDQIEKIRRLGIPFVFLLEKDSSKVETKQTDKEPFERQTGEVSVKQKDFNSGKNIEEGPSSARLYRIKYQKCNKVYEETLYEIKSLMNGLLFFSEESLKDSEKMIRKMVDTLINDTSTMIFLIHAKHKQEEVFHHALNVCILSLLLAKASNISPEDMFTVGLGALFHDIGKLRIPKSLLLKTQPLTKAERAFLKLHPQFGVEIVSRIESFPEDPKRIISGHHETIDGKGYPKGLKGDEIDIPTRIVSIVNTYDNLCNPYIIERAMTPYQTLAFMYKKLSDKLDKKLIELFIHLVGVYPPGTIVQLSNGSVGIVVSKSSNRPNRPYVLMYDPKVPPSKAPVVSLENEPSLNIEKTLHPLTLSQEVLSYLNPPMRIAYMLDSLATKK